jgi:hypothetical protein
LTSLTLDLSGTTLIVDLSSDISLTLNLGSNESLNALKGQRGFVESRGGRALPSARPSCEPFHIPRRGGVASCHGSFAKAVMKLADRRPGPLDGNRRAARRNAP